MPHYVTSQDRGEPRFELIYETSHITRRNVEPDDIAAAMFEGGARRSFSSNTLKMNKLLLREGEWVTTNASNDLIRALATRGPAWPIWQDPGSGEGRFDAQGGVTMIEGKWLAITNMIDDGFDDAGVDGLQPGDELKVGILGPLHPYAGATGLVPVNDAATGTFIVVAHVEAVLEDGFVVVSNHLANYKVTVTQVLTSLPPTTAAPTT